MENTETNPIAEAVAETVADAIVDANAEAERAAAISAMVVAGAMETERGERIATLERRMDEWQGTMNDLSEATAALVMGFTSLEAKVSMLTPQQSPMPNPPSGEEAGQQESQDLPETIVVVEPEAPPPVLPVAPPPKKKRFNLI